MTTAEHLEGMTDPGKFELLALRVLRELFDECKSLVHLGTNAEGKTVPSPIDAFCLVPGSRPHRYVMNASTISKREELKRKWLFNPASHRGTAGLGEGAKQDEGDLIKAGKEAAEIRKCDPDAHFVLYLCTNRIPARTLMTEIHTRADALGIEVRFLEQTQVRDFLDSKPEGQWLRQEHLGTKADLVSRSLLQELSRHSLATYLKEMLFMAPESIIETRAQQIAHDNIHESTCHLHLLVGSSGVGKSLIGYDLLRRQVERGGLGLWIPGRILDGALTLSDAIERVLLSLSTRLDRGAGQAALRLSTVDDPLIVVVDDLNRLPNASQLLQRLFGWCRPTGHRVKGPERQSSTIRVACPVWDSNWLVIRSLCDSIGWVRMQPVGPFVRAESVECLRNALGDLASRFSAAELNEFSDALKDDPILLGLFGGMLRRDPDSNPQVLSQDVIGKMVERSLAELVSRYSHPLDQYTATLSDLAKRMIHRKCLFPSWAELEAWFQGETERLLILGQLVTQGSLCLLTKQGDEQRFQFRHDRILEHYLQRGIAEILSLGDRIAESVWDPYFTPHLAKALVLRSQSATGLDLVQKRNPVALLAAIEHLTPDQSEYAQHVVHKAHEWIGSANSALPSVRNDAYNVLESIQSPHVLTVTEGLEGHEAILRARLRNGDALAGARALSQEFFPAIRFDWLETLLSQARSRHGPALAAGLESLLNSTALDERLRTGAMILAGYLADSRLAEPLRAAWKNAPDQLATLPEALWAALRCSNDAPQESLDPLMQSVMMLETGEAGGRLSSRESVLEQISLAVRHGISDSVIGYLVELGQTRKYRWIVTAILDRLDHPLAIEYVVRCLALSAHHARGKNLVPLYALHWKNQWRKRAVDGGRVLSPRSLAVLRSLWETTTHPDWLREYAFDVWVRAEGEISALRSIQTTSPLYSTAVWNRALNGDRTVVPEIVAKLEDKSHWLHVVPRIWCSELQGSLESWIQQACRDKSARSDLQHEVTDTLRDIPRADAETLLLRHWDGLARKPLAIQLALYLATPDTRARAAESIELLGKDRTIFQYISFFFGFTTSELSDRLTIEQLESLQPWIECLDGICIAQMCQFCRTHGYWDWALRFLRQEFFRRCEEARQQGKEDRPFISGSLKEYFPTDQDLLSDLDQLERNPPSNSDLWFWSERFITRGDPPERMFQILEDWVKNAPSIHRYRIASSLVRDRGSRSHLRMLQSCTDLYENAEGQALFADAQYAVSRRSLD